MSEKNSDKIIRQLQMYDYITSTKYHGPTEIMSEFPVSESTLQRDIKDLRDSGLINLQYDREKDNYKEIKNLGFNENIQGRRRQHLIRLNRIGNLMVSLTQTDLKELESYELLCEEYEYVLEHPEEFPADVIYDNEYPELPALADLKAEYYELFPNSSERTRQRDFNALRDAGYVLIYIKEYHNYIFTTEDTFNEEAYRIRNRYNLDSE
jgi:predicted DNA-binding transcriptional regulator YafY